MKNTNYFKSSLMILLMCFGLTSAWGQYAVDFDGNGDGTHSTQYGFENHNLNGVTWSGDQVMIPIEPLSGDWYIGVRSLRLRGYAASHFTMTQNKPDGIGEVNFQYAQYGSDAQQSWRVEYSLDNGATWSQLGEDFIASSSVSTFNENLNAENARIRIICLGSGTSNRRMNIDNLEITNYVNITDPILSASSTSIIGLTYMEGEGPSATQSFELSGANLEDENVLISLGGTDFEISLDGTNYDSDLELEDYNGEATTIYARLKSGLATGNYTDEISILGDNAEEIIVVLEGEVTEFTNICGLETFTNIPPNASGYAERSWIGDDGITWQAQNARTDQTLSGRAITLQMGSITNTSEINGVGKVTFDYARAFSGNSTLQLFVNDVPYGDEIFVSDTSATQASIDVNLAGNAIIRIESSGQRVTIDNLSWTCYSDATEAITWTDGTWSNGDGPTINDDAVIDDVLFVGMDFPSFEAKSLTVTENGIVEIEAGNSITVAEGITNNAGAENFVVHSGASLVQTSDVANVGEITVERSSGDLVANDVTFWSSPVAEQSISAFTAAPYNASDVWAYDSASDAFVNSSDTEFQEGTGYAIRSNSFTGVYDASFVGVPTNGDVTFEGSTDGLRYNLVGNPYASPINAYDFFEGNTDVTRLLFWTHTAPLVNGHYASSNYAHFTEAGGVASAAGGQQPNGQIQVGQGFMARIATGGNTTLTFNNDMREANNEGQFYRNTNVERNRIWLNLTSDVANHNQLMIAYMSGATEGVDAKIDASFMNYNGNAIYTLIEDNRYIIQGKGLPFETSDVVALGLKVVEAGNFTISIENVDGLFADGQVVYLKDKALDITHNLSESAYSFTSEIGDFNDRFEVVYETDGTMGTGDLTANSVQVYTQNHNIVVSSKSEKILSVELFDMSGRTIHSNQKVNSNQYQIASASKGVLVVRVLTQNGEVVTKKVINQ